MVSCGELTLHSSSDKLLYSAADTELLPYGVPEVVAFLWGVRALTQTLRMSRTTLLLRLDEIGCSETSISIGYICQVEQSNYLLCLTFSTPTKCFQQAQYKKKPKPQKT